MTAQPEQISALEAAYLASACIEASRHKETAVTRVLTDVALQFDPETAPVSIRAVRKALEEGIVPSHDRDRVLLDLNAVLYLASTQSLEGAFLSADVKAKIYGVIEGGADRVELAPLISLDLGEIVRLGRRLLKSYSEARNRWVESDPGTMGGLPVVRGTRIPVYTILGRIEEGETLDEIAHDFDHVPRQALEAALAYARTHPRRGRPKQFR